MTSGHSRPARFRSSKSGKRTNALRISELEQALLNASTSNVALLNAKGEILAVNEAWLQYGRNNSKTPGKLPAKISVGTNYLEVLKNTSGVDEADAAAAMAAILSVLKGRKRSVSIEYPCSVPGQTDWFKMTVTILKGKTRRVLVAHENISAQKLLETSRIEMQQLVETNPSGFATYREHPDGRISMPFVSKRWEELVELRAEDVATDATPFISRAHPDDLPMLVEQLEKARKNHSVIKVEYRLRTPSRGTRWVEVYAAPRRDPDGSTVFMGSLTDITDHKLAESALLDNRALEHQMSRFVQIAPGAYYSFSHQSNGRAQLRFASPRFEELAGPLLEQLKVDFWQCFQLAHPEDINNIKKSVLEAFQRQVPWHQEFRIVQANGEVVWMEGWAEPSQQQQDEILWYGIMMEITHRKKAEEARKKIEDELIQSEYNYRILAENIGSPVATCDENGVFLYVNNTFASLNGMTPEQMIGGVYFPNIPEERVHTRILKIREVLASGQPYSDEIVDNVNGERKWHLRTMRPMRIKGNFKQVLITGHDITEHKKEQELLSRYAQDLEQQVRLRTQELEDALSKERELAELKSRFVSTTSHEFRTPLSTISLTSGFIKRYLARLPVQTINEKLDLIEKQVRHMSTLLDDILKIGIIEAGKLEVHLEQLPLQPFIQELAQEVESEKGTHTINCSIDCELEWMTTDEKLLRQVIINLLSNAIKFSPGHQSIELRLGCNDSSIDISVSDHGIGIPMEDQEGLFQAFHRGSNAMTIQGTGLGLSIVKKAVDLLGGSISFVSAPGNGTTFKVSLPTHHG